MVNRIVVGAHYGLKDWLLQRLSAVVMAVCVMIWVVYFLGFSKPLTFESWKATFGMIWFRLVMLMFVVGVLVHAWVGVRDIWMDYVKNTGIRLALQVLTVLWLTACAGWSAQTIWRL